MVFRSAGGACVHYHILSSLSRGLFHRAISQSGNAFVTWASQDNPQDQALYYASQMNCLKATMTKTAKCLRGLSSDKIARSQRSAAVITRFQSTTVWHHIKVLVLIRVSIFVGYPPSQICAICAIY